MEGAVGSYWGVYDVNRKPKFEFTGTIVRVPEWHILAAVSVAVALLLLGLLYLNSDALRNRGRSFLALVVYAAATLAVWVIYDFTQQYMTVSSVISGVLLLLGMLGVLLVLLAEAHEWAEAHWVSYRRRLGSPIYTPSATPPKVSVHVPAYNEPPDDAHRDARCARAPGVPGLRSAGDRQQHQGRGGLAPGGGALREARAALPLLPRGAAGGLQGRRAELRAPAHRAGRRDRRGHRQRLRGRAALAARPHARLPRPAHRHRAGTAGLPRRRPERLQGHVLRRVPRLLPHRHDHAQRAQRHHPARHHDHGAPHAAGQLPLGRVVHHRGRRARACASSRAASTRATCPTATGAA